MKLISKIAYLSFIKAGYSFERKFNKITTIPAQVNQKTLFSILKNNANCEFGKVHNFNKITSVDEYKNNVALGTYDSFEKHILRMSLGEKNVLLENDVEYFGLSSGTTGKQKLLPITKASRNVTSKYMGILTQRIIYNNLKNNWHYGRGVMLTDLIIGKYTEGGIPISSATSGGMRGMRKLIPYIWTSPLEVMELKDKETAFYLHILFALKEENLIYISGIFISSVLDFFRYMEKNWTSLVNDIKYGKINSNLNIDKTSLNPLLNYLKPDKKRADKLELEFKKGFASIGTRIWPNLMVIQTVTGANFSIYDDEVNNYTGEIPIYSGAYGASECTVGINPYLDKIRYTILPDTAFFEFIPVEFMDKQQPITKLIDELEINHCYEVVTTNYAGLYRYRLGDVIKVVGKYNNSPEVEFMYRKNQVLNMAAEKTTEQHILRCFKRNHASF